MRSIKLCGLMSVIGLFVLVRLISSGVRLSDTAVYFYSGKELLAGKMLYRDVFWSNLPVSAFLFAGIFKITGGNPELFYLSGGLEAVIIGGLIFLLGYRQSRSYLISLTAMGVFLFSDWALNITATQNGVFFPAICSLTAYWLLVRKKFFWSGVIMAAGLLTKAYFAPVALGLGLYLLLLKRWRETFMWLCGAILISGVIILPFLFISPGGMQKGLVQYALGRAGGFKAEVLTYLGQTDWMLIILFLIGLFNTRRQKIIALISWSFVLFFIWYKDFRYLYLISIIPFVCLTAADLTIKIKDNFNRWWIIPAIFGLLMILNINWYFSVFGNFELVTSINEMTAAIQNEKPAYLYGTDQLTPILSHKTGVPLLGNVIDTNENMFRTGILDKAEMTRKAVADRTIVVSYGLDYPERRVYKTISPDIFDEAVYTQKCGLLKTFPVWGQAGVNMITLSKCGY